MDVFLHIVTGANDKATTLGTLYSAPIEEKDYPLCPGTGQIASIGVRFRENVFEKPFSWYTADSIEKLNLINFWEFIGKFKQQFDLITFNGRIFDIPFLTTRSAINKVKPTAFLPTNKWNDVFKKEFGGYHFDLFEFFRYKGTLAYWAASFGYQVPIGDTLGELTERNCEAIERLYYAIKPAMMNSNITFNKLMA